MRRRGGRARGRRFARQAFAAAGACLSAGRCQARGVITHASCRAGSASDPFPDPPPHTHAHTHPPSLFPIRHPPGHPEYELRPGGADQTVDAASLPDYLAAVVAATFGAGVSVQFEAFRGGFQEVVPLAALEVFFEDEVEVGSVGSGAVWSLGAGRAAAPAA